MVANPRFGFYVKSSIVTTLLFIESFYLASVIYAFVKAGDLFSFDYVFATQVVIIMLLLLWTFALSIGAWGKYLQFFIVPLPLALGIMLSLIFLEPTYAVFTTVFTILLLSYDLIRSTRLRDLLLKFEPHLVLRLSTSGILFVFSILAGIFVILDTTGYKDLDLGKTVTGMVGDSVDKIVQEQVNNAITSEIGGTLTDPSVSTIMSSLGLPTNVTDLSLYTQDALEFNTKGIIEDQVNRFVSPYKNLLQPIMAIYLFGVFQIYAAIAATVFNLSIGPVFFIAKKTGFFKREIIQVEKEHLSF